MRRKHAPDPFRALHMRSPKLGSNTFSWWRIPVGRTAVHWILHAGGRWKGREIIMPFDRLLMPGGRAIVAGFLRLARAEIRGQTA